jgi:hypothetical protein
MPGPPPKPAHLRQRTNRKAGSATLKAPSAPDIPKIPNPDKRKWHPLTLAAWAHAWASPMASQWLETDADALGRLALVWDQFYKSPNADALKEIRLQSALFGLSPLDRSRLQWEVSRADEVEEKKVKREASLKRTGTDPRRILQMVSK